MYTRPRSQLHANRNRLLFSCKSHWKQRLVVYVTFLSATIRGSRWKQVVCADLQTYCNSEVKCVVDLSFFKEVSQNSFVFELRSFIFEGSLAEKLRFYASKLHFWRKSRRKETRITYHQILAPAKNAIFVISSSSKALVQVVSSSNAKHAQKDWWSCLVDMRPTSMHPLFFQHIHFVLRKVILYFFLSLSWDLHGIVEGRGGSLNKEFEFRPCHHGRQGGS